MRQAARDRTVEWSSSFFGQKQYDNDLELYHDAVDETFRDSLQFSHLDDKAAELWLPNPCALCPLVRSESGGVYFCGDQLNLQLIDDSGHRQVASLYVGVRQERDYLHDNGGRLPNACIIIQADDIDSSCVLAQYMSQEWNDGSRYAQEWGFIVRNTAINSFINTENDAEAYVNFAKKLQAPRNTRSRLGGGGGEWSVLWTYNHKDMMEHRERMSENVHQWISNAI